MTAPSSSNSGGGPDLPQGFPIPEHSDQNPEKWSSDQLTRHGLPPKPDGKFQPRLHAAWMDAFGHPLHFIPYVAEFEEVIGRPDVEERAAVSRASRFVSSPNWSGATISATDGRTFSQIYGTWMISKVRRPSDEPGDVCRCASWIGFDGQRRYLTATLPQIGTLDTVTSHSSAQMNSTLQAWTQWWVPHDPDARPVFMKNFPLDHGDEITAVMTVTTPSRVVCNLINQSTDPPTIVCIEMHAPHIHSRNSPLPSAERYSVAGATAEWVLERPAVLGQVGVLDTLGDFGTTSFRACLAFEAKQDGSAPVTRSLDNARFIRMFEIKHSPERKVYVSMPDRMGDAGFRVRCGDVWS